MLVVRLDVLQRLGLIEKVASDFVVVSIVDIDAGVDSGAWSRDPDPVCR
jgi:hypothetical protein